LKDYDNRKGKKPIAVSESDNSSNNFAITLVKTANFNEPTRRDPFMHGQIDKNPKLIKYIPG